jgi:hypothetical protein
MGTNPSGVARLTEAEGVEHPHQVFASRGAEAKITRVGRATLVLLPECFIDTCPNPLGPSWNGRNRGASSMSCGQPTQAPCMAPAFSR